MKDRTFEILECALRDHIKTGEAITSDRLYRFHDFGIKPAMIRWELNDLSDAGYLVQTHHSGGRLPTDRAYRYFAERALEDEAVALVKNPANRITEFLEYLHEDREREFVEEISRRLHSFGVGYAPKVSEIYESGLPSLFERLQVNSRNDLLQIVRDLDQLPHRLEALCGKWLSDDLWPKVFVGRNPLMESDNLSLLAQKIEHGGGVFMFFAVGPKRMDYQKSLRLLSQMNPVRGRGALRALAASNGMRPNKTLKSRAKKNKSNR